MATLDLTAPVLLEIDARGVAQVILNRPERNNAYDGDLIQALLAALDQLEKASGLRAVIIAGAGQHFQAGADLKWIDAVRARLARRQYRRLARHRAGDLAAQSRAGADHCAGAGRLLRRRHRAPCRLRRGDRRRRCDFFHRRSALGPVRGDHHPAAQRRHRRSPGAPLRADRRALLRRGSPPHRPRA